MSSNTECPHFLGSHINETILGRILPDVMQMSFGNQGYDFTSASGDRLDAKSSVLHKKHGNGMWTFYINRNTSADFFVLTAFDNRVSLNILHMWLIPGDLLNDRRLVGISASTIERWSQWELPTDAAQRVIDDMRSNGEI